MSVAVQELDSLDDLAGVFQDMADQLNAADYTETLDAMLPELEETHQQYFDDRKSPHGEPWPDWFFTEIDTGEHPTLEASGDLRRSLRTGGSGNIKFTDRRALEWGTNVEYAGIHNFGARITTGVWLISRNRQFALPPGSTLEIPQREFMGLNEKNAQFFVDMAADAAVEFLKPE